VTKGVKVSRSVYERFGKTHRIYPDPLTCNCLILPDGTIVQMTDLALHMRYLKTAILLEALRNIKYTMRLQTPFTLDLSQDGRPILLHNGTLVTEVSFPPASRFYEQRTSSDLPYLGNAVLQGMDFLSFQCLWPCQFAKTGHACQFCYSGGVAERLSKRNKPDPPVPTPRDAAEIVEFAVTKEKSASHIQITGGSTLNTQAECRVIVQYLSEIHRVVGLEMITVRSLCTPRRRKTRPRWTRSSKRARTASRAVLKSGTRNWRRSLHPAKRDSPAGNATWIV